MPRNGDSRAGTLGSMHWTSVDSKATFRIKLRPGRYKIAAKAEGSGYPDPVFALNSDATARFPEISVEHDEVTGVLVMLGEKGGVIQGETIDQKSRTPVSNAKITIKDAEHPQAYVDVFSDQSGHFQFAVPGKPLLISGSATGYESVSRPTETALSSGEHRNIVLEFRHK